jgi:hypothetical protein
MKIKRQNIDQKCVDLQEDKLNLTLDLAFESLSFYDLEKVKSRETLDAKHH